MATKRTPLRRNPRHRIAPEIVALWTRLVEIDAAGGDEEWEPVGRRREFLDASRELNRALGIPPWGWSPIEIQGDEPPDWVQAEPFRLEAWRKGQEWRQELEAACALGL